ncbi:hypothetical protein GTP45_27395 [Pseudoduganella sp. FT55W]|uniref:Peptidase S24/S26A/S26B/S26C domain-containing protein n=1 Tax=Duganella rivi TaxID=2666083 RepID=A0A7X4KEZ1_9BURK|nr:LexA family transcriptional regulator [Duganella rivi]MYM70507.1 hypothetical protein [Duganella rivi]
MDNEKIDVAAVVDRMKLAVGVQKDIELAAYLEISKSAPAVWKSRETTPIAECIKIAIRKACSLDWLILGRGGFTTEDVENTITEGIDSGGIALPLFDMRTYLVAGASAPSFVTVPRALMDEQGLSAGETMIVRACGDAMLGTIDDGQYMVIDRRPRNTDGVYLVRFGDVLRVARLQRMVRGATRVSYENTSYAVDVIPPEGGDSIEVIGFCQSKISRVF